MGAFLAIAFCTLPGNKGQLPCPLIKSCLLRKQSGLLQIRAELIFELLSLLIHLPQLVFGAGCLGAKTLSLEGTGRPLSCCVVWVE